MKNNNYNKVDIKTFGVRDINCLTLKEQKEIVLPQLYAYANDVLEQIDFLQPGSYTCTDVAISINRKFDPYAYCLRRIVESNDPTIKSIPDTKWMRESHRLIHREHKAPFYICIMDLFAAIYCIEKRTGYGINRQFRWTVTPPYKCVSRFKVNMPSYEDICELKDELHTTKDEPALLTFTIKDCTLYLSIPLKEAKETTYIIPHSSIAPSFTCKIGTNYLSRMYGECTIKVFSDWRADSINDAPIIMIEKNGFLIPTTEFNNNLKNHDTTYSYE